MTSYQLLRIFNLLLPLINLVKLWDGGGGLTGILVLHVDDVLELGD